MNHLQFRRARACFGPGSAGAGFAHALPPVRASALFAAALARRSAFAIAAAAVLAPPCVACVVAPDQATFLACVLVVEPPALGFGLDAFAWRELRAGDDTRLHLITIDPLFALPHYCALAILAALAALVAIADTFTVADDLTVAYARTSVIPSDLISVTSPITPTVIASVICALVTAAVFMPLIAIAVSAAVAPPALAAVVSMALELTVLLHDRPRPRARRRPVARHPVVAMADPVPVAVDPDVAGNRRQATVFHARRWGHDDRVALVVTVVVIVVAVLIDRHHGTAAEREAAGEHKGPQSG